MLSIVTGLFSGVGLKMMAAAGAVLTAVAVYFAVKKSGEQQQQVADLRVAQKETGVARKVSNEVDRMSDDDVDRRLRDPKTGG